MIIFKQVTVVKGRASQLPRFEALPEARGLAEDLNSIQRRPWSTTGWCRQTRVSIHQIHLQLIEAAWWLYHHLRKNSHGFKKRRPLAKKTNFEPYALVCHQLAVRPWSQACKTTLGHHWVCHWTDTTDLREKCASIKFLHLPQLKRTIKVLRSNVGKECAFMG